MTKINFQLNAQKNALSFSSDLLPLLLRALADCDVTITSENPSIQMEESLSVMTFEIGDIIHCKDFGDNNFKLTVCKVDGNEYRFEENLSELYLADEGCDRYWVMKHEELDSYTVRISFDKVRNIYKLEYISNFYG